MKNEPRLKPYTKLRKTLQGIKKSVERGIINEQEADKNRSRALSDFKNEERTLSEKRNEEINKLLKKHDMILLERGHRSFDIVQDALYCATEQWKNEGRLCMYGTASEIELCGIVVKL